MLCLTSLRCRLCQFHLEEGDLAIAVAAHGPTSTNFFYCRPGGMTSVRAHETGTPGVLRIHAPIREGVTEHKGCLTRYRGEAYHSDCYQFNEGAPSRRYLAATRYSLDPGPSFTKKRWRGVEEMLALRLLGIMSGGLPLELWRKVAGLLVSECAVSNMQRVVRETSSANSMVLSVSTAIYAQHCWVEGVRYIQALQTDPSPCLISDPGQSKVGAVHIAEDHLGVTEIVCSSGEEMICRPLQGYEPRTGIWWTVLDTGWDDTRLRVLTDGIKIRSIYDDATPMYESQPHRYKVYCDVPLTMQPPLVVDESKLLPHSRALRLLADGSRAIRLTTIPLNSPDTVGYAMAWTEDAILYLQACREYQHDPATYREMDDGKHAGAMWSFFPVDPGEMIQEIWERVWSEEPRRTGTSHSPDSLLLVTTKGKFVLLGSYLSSGRINRGFWRVLYKPPLTPSLMFLDAAAELMTATFSGGPFSPRPHPTYLTATSTPQFLYRNGQGVDDVDLYFSSASLHDVKEVTVCYSPTGTVLGGSTLYPVVGMMFHYEDGRRACVGQYRLDWAKKSLQVGEEPKLCMGFGRVEENDNAHMMAVELSSPTDRADWEWVDVPFRGQLEWWTTLDQTQVSYEGRVSLFLALTSSSTSSSSSARS